MLLRTKSLALFCLLLLLPERNKDLHNILKRVSGRSSVQPGLFFSRGWTISSNYNLKGYDDGV
jgi:hypothetical protein